MNTGLMFSSKTDEWATPQYLFDKLNEEFNFTLDAAANAENHKCNHYFDKETNGLLKSWEGESVFCNPPYGRHIGEWVKKAYMESLNKETIVVMLVPARTDTKWFHDYIYHHADIRFIRGRIKFGGCKYNAPFPSMVVVFHGAQQTKFQQITKKSFE